MKKLLFLCSAILLFGSLAVAQETTPEPQPPTEPPDNDTDTNGDVHTAANIDRDTNTDLHRDQPGDNTGGAAIIHANTD